MGDLLAGDDRDGSLDEAVGRPGGIRPPLGVHLHVGLTAVEYGRGA